MDCIKSHKDGQKRSSHSSKKTKEQQVEVLYQKMGDRWFAFSLINDEVFVGSIPQKEIDSASTKPHR